MTGKRSSEDAALAQELHGGSSSGSGNPDPGSAKGKSIQDVTEKTFGGKDGDSDPLVQFHQAFQQSELNKDKFKEFIMELHAQLAANTLFNDEQVQSMADELFNNNIKSVKSFMKSREDLELFKPKSPESPTQEEDDRLQIYKKIKDRAKALFEAVSQRVQEKFDVREQVENVDEDEESYDMKKKKKKKKKKDDTKKKKKRRSSSTSKSSSESSASLRREKRRKKFDKILNEMNISHLGPGVFPETKLVNEVYGRKKDKYISSRPLECWVPSSLGANLPKAEQKKLHEDRSKAKTLLIAELIQHSTAFWLTHSMNGIVNRDSILIHQTVLAGIASRTTQDHAARYERHLIQFLREKLFRGEISENVNEYLDRVVQEIDSIIGISSFSETKDKKKEPGWKKDKAKDGGKGKGNEKKQPKGGGKWTPSNTPNPPVRPPKGKGKDNRSSVACRFHDPANGRFCNIPTCPFFHLNPRNDPNANGDARDRRAVLRPGPR